MLKNAYKKDVFVVVGPTASGKTNYAINLAHKINGEIISADSMQVYKHMNIGTAKPNEEEQQGIKHHMIDLIEPSEKFSVSEYSDLAKNCIEEIFKKNKIPIICGGTGLYINSIVQNINFCEMKVDYKLRENLMNKGKRLGGQVLLKELSEFDPETSNELHPNNLKRIVRAIEIFKTSGITMSEQKKCSKKISPYNFYIIGLNYINRENLYKKINIRVDYMIEKGLIEEVKKLFNEKINITAQVAIGYKELFSYLNGDVSLKQAIEMIKINTRHYAKRQLTWFKKDKNIIWFER